VEFPAGSALALYLIWLIMFFTPKLSGFLDAALRSPARYGGLLNLARGAAVETLFILMLVPVQWFTHVLATGALLLGRSIHWDAPNREGYRVTWRAAAEHLWPHTAFGVALIAFLAFTAPGAIVWFLPFAAGLVLSIPFAVLTASPELGQYAVERRLCAIPEEIEPLPELAALARKPAPKSKSKAKPGRARKRTRKANA
jgi:membrane glycosyltransferase